MVSRFRRFEYVALTAGNSSDNKSSTATGLAITTAARSSRQLIVAVTANGAECGECDEHGFDEICPKPLSRNDIYRIINTHFL